jgi:site-specific DNA-methyltransferase (adenine-specific)
MMTMTTAVTGPTVKRFKSVQVVSTPWAFIRAVERKFGPLVVDLAATAENAKCARFITPEIDTFTQDWTQWLQGGLGWLNPMKKWVELCARQRQNGAEFVVLTPASVSTNWFWDHVQPYATVYCVTPRLVFADNYQLDPSKPNYGELITDPYPKDLMLSHYCPKPSRELQRWRWRSTISTQEEN